MDLVHKFTENGCFLTVENTLLGYVANDLTWCGKEGNSGKILLDLGSWFAR